MHHPPAAVIGPTPVLIGVSNDRPAQRFGPETSNSVGTMPNDAAEQKPADLGADTYFAPAIPLHPNGRKAERVFGSYVL